MHRALDPAAGAQATWVVWLPSTAGKRPKITLADVAALQLKQARDKAGRRADAKDGKNPLEARRVAKVKAEEDVWRGRQDLSEGTRRAQAAAAHPRRDQALSPQYWEPLHDQPLSAVTSEDIDARVHEILHEHGPSTGPKARTYLNMALSWAMRQPRLRVKVNPVVGTAPPEVDVENGRPLSPGRIGRIWRACENRGEFGVIVRHVDADSARVAPRWQACPGRNWTSIRQCGACRRHAARTAGRC